MTVFAKRTAKKAAVFIAAAALIILNLIPAASRSAAQKNTPAGAAVNTPAADGLLGAAASVCRQNNADARLMTLNLLAHYKSFGGAPVKTRAPIFAALINSFLPDAAALQEMCPDWFLYIDVALPDYGIINRTQTALTDRMTALIFNKNTLKPTASGDFELTPSDDYRMRRAVWAVFETKASGRRFAVISAHLSLNRANDENGAALCLSQSAQLIALTEKIAAEYCCPVYILGDFNTKTGGSEQSAVYAVLSKVFTDTAAIAAQTVSGAQPVTGSANDHIFLYGNSQIKQYHLLSYKLLNEMSDHYPICADVCIGAQNRKE